MPALVDVWVVFPLLLAVGLFIIIALAVGAVCLALTVDNPISHVCVAFFPVVCIRASPR